MNINARLLRGQRNHAHRTRAASGLDQLVELDQIGRADVGCQLRAGEFGAEYGPSDARPGFWPAGRLTAMRSHGAHRIQRKRACGHGRGEKAVSAGEREARHGIRRSRVSVHRIAFVTPCTCTSTKPGSIAAADVERRRCAPPQATGQLRRCARREEEPRAQNPARSAPGETQPAIGRRQCTGVRHPRPLPAA